LPMNPFLPFSIPSHASKVLLLGTIILFDMM
jgi:hypothetical protein